MKYKARPDAEHFTALEQFAAMHGRTWKSQLRECWMSGIYPGGVDSAALQRIRNTFGPSWLVRFSFKAYRNAPIYLGTIVANDDENDLGLPL